MTSSPFRLANDDGCPGGLRKSFKWKIVCCELTSNMKFFVFAVFFCGIGTNLWSKGEKQVGCDPRYFQHYLVKGCKPEYGTNESECPIRFNCPQATPPETSGCRFQGDLISPGQDIPTGNPCQLCSCRPGWDGGAPEIVCIGVECPSAFGPPLDDNCYELFEKDKCCSTKKQCGSTVEPRTSCVHKGETFFAGQQIYPDKDPCVVCTCGEGWTGNVHSDPNCKRHACLLEKNMKQLTLGCLPIYHQSTCCPIEFDCGENLQNTTIPSATTQEIESGNTCAFKGSHYRIGQLLDIAHPTNCVTCTCTTPPEFTCVHKVCVYPTDDNCVPTYHPGTCCPTFDCTSTPSR